MTRLHRAAAVVAVAVLLAALFVTDHFAADRAPQASAADAAEFDPGMLITDELFFDGRAMTVAQVQSFLDEKGRNCTSNCLRNFAQATQSHAATSRCDGYTGRSRETAAEIIVNVANSCGISPKVLLVMLEKETSLVTMNGPGDWRYERAMGYYCPDDPARPGWCHPDYGGFFNQVFNAAGQMQRYVQNPNDYGYLAGRWNNILYNPDASCGSERVYIENKATAALYIYTPYVPNRAAMDNLYGSGDYCSAYGNRNFWRLYTDWFGPTTGAPASVAVTTARNPYGTVDAVNGGSGAIRISGWGIDPDDMTASLYVWVTIDGKGQHLLANAPRPDVQRALPGAGPNQGFDAVLEAAPGEREVCATLANIGPGSHTPLECSTVNVPAAAAANPMGALDAVTSRPGLIDVRGWAYEPDNSFASTYVYVTVDGKGGHIRADRSRPDVARVYPEAGAYRGYEATYRVSAGEHRVCVSLHNTGAGEHVGLGCRTLEVAAGTNFPPTGHLDGVTVLRGGAQLSGWAFDADTPSSARVVVTVDGRDITAIRTGSARPDVARVIDSRAGYAGFSTAISLSAGAHRVCASVIDSGTTDTTPLGCRTVAVPSSAPVGSVDSIRSIPGGIRVSGWAADIDATGPIYVWVTINGEGRHVLANGYRPDVQKAYAMFTANSGFTVDLPLPNGPATLCVTASNTGAGSHTQFGCSEIRG